MDGGPPVFPPGFTCPAVLWIPAVLRHFHLRDSHPLWPAVPRRSIRWKDPDAGPNPEDLRPSVWPPPRSLATTCGISVDVFSCPYLDVSVQCVPPVRLFHSTHGTQVLPAWVSPFGNLRISAHLQLPEAYRSLSRPSSAPDAKAFPLRSFQLDLRRMCHRCMQSVACDASMIRSGHPPFSIRTRFAGLRIESGERFFSDFWFSFKNYAGHRSSFTL